MRRILTACLLVGSLCAAALAAEPKKLPPPRTEGGKPLMQALNERKSSRDFSPAPLSDQMLGNLLWAADGVNREDGRRTAPSARNWQEIDIYVVTAGGSFRYDAGEHSLAPVVDGDLRPKTGTQPFVSVAPVNLVYVADLSRMGKGGNPADLETYAAADAGFIAQNVYLYCASENLACVVRGLIDKPALSQALKLRPDQKVILAHTVGHPAEK